MPVDLRSRSQIAGVAVLAAPGSVCLIGSRRQAVKLPAGSAAYPPLTADASKCGNICAPERNQPAPATAEVVHTYVICVSSETPPSGVQRLSSCRPREHQVSRSMASGNARRDSRIRCPGTTGDTGCWRRRPGHQRAEGDDTATVEKWATISGAQGQSTGRN